MQASGVSFGFAFTNICKKVNMVTRGRCIF